MMEPSQHLHDAGNHERLPVNVNRSSPMAPYDLWSAETRSDPYPLYDQIRAEQPLFWTGRSWIFTRYADVLAVLLDARWSADRTEQYFSKFSAEERAECAAFADARRGMMLFTDPPNHTRLRGLVTQAFSARMVENMRPRIQQIVDELLDDVQLNGEIDIIRDLANPLPSAVIADMLGVPREDQEQFKAWANAFAVAIGSQGNHVQHARDASRAANEMGRYLEAITDQRRLEPQDDLITALLMAEEEGHCLSHEELVATCILLLNAGNETTTNLIGNGLLTLLRHPEQLQRLRDDPLLIRTAVEELLRYESPIQYTVRIAREDIDLAGQRIHGGEGVTLLIGAANRDPEQFLEPGTLDIARRPNRHIAFGHGPHFCLGAPLARAQGQMAISSVVQRFTALRLMDDHLEWREIAAFRGLRSLPVAIA